MAKIYKKIENGFSNVTRWVYDKKYLTIIAVVLCTGILAFQTANLTIDIRDESFFHDDDPTLIAYNQFRDTFGQDDTFIIAMQPRNGLTLEFMELLHRFHQDLEASVPYLDEVTSLANARVVRAEGDTLIVDELMKTPPETEAARERIFDQIDRYPLYENLLISKDRRMAFILVKARAVIPVGDQDVISGFDDDGGAEDMGGTATTYLSNDQNMEINDAIHKIAAGYKSPDIDFHFSGTPAFVAEIQKGIIQDMSIMVPLSFFIIALFLLLLFRNISGVIYPIITVALSLLASLGIMAMVGIPITNAIQILPTFLVVVGIGDSVHILTIFYRNYRLCGDKRRAIIDAVGFAGLPVLMTSFTTSLGLLSFAWADVAIVAQLGYIAPVGVMLAFIYTVILLPALISALPVKQPKAKGSASPLSDKIFDAIARVATSRPIFVTVIFLCIMAGAIYSSLSVKFSHSSLKWLPPDTDIRRSTEFLDRVNGGTVMLDVVIDSGRPNGMHDPDLLQRLDEAVAFIPSINTQGVQAGKATALTDVLKEINRALNEGRDEAYALPDNRELIAQELLLFESSGSDDLEEITTENFQMSRVSVLAPFADAMVYTDYVREVEDFLRKKLPETKITLTGHIVIFVQMIKRFVTTMAKSYIIALVVITILMVVLIGRIGIGLMSMVANLAPVLCTFGIMGLADIPLDMSTIFIGSIVLGLVVDDTIHFLHHFRKAYDQIGDVYAAVRETLHTTGRALVITSLVLSGGFFIYTASFLVSNSRFGWLCGCAILLALAADFFLIPALLTLIMRRASRKSVIMESSASDLELAQE